MRINVTQIKVEMAMQYFNNIYKERERERERERGGGGGRKKKKKRNVERMKERKRERMRGRGYLSFSRDASYMGCKKPFIGFTI